MERELGGEVFEGRKPYPELRLTLNQKAQISSALWKA
jgi:hypothetical protein